MRIKKPVFVSFLVLMSVLAYVFFRIWQGLDFMDHGYWLSSYQQFSANPEQIEGVIVYWGTLAIGGLWNNLFGQFGLVSFKFAYVLVNILLVMLAYYGLRQIFPELQKVLLGFIIVTFIYITKKIGIIGYNNLTGLFYLAGSLLLIFGLIRRKPYLLLLAGALVGFNIFVRFPNILGFLLITGVFLFGYLEKWRIKQVLYYCCIFILGIVISIAFTVLLMQQMGHLDYYLNSLRDLLGNAQNSGSHHSANTLLLLLPRDYFLAFSSALVILAVTVYFVRKISSLSSWYRWGIILLAAIVASPILATKHIGDWLIPGVIYISLGLFFFKNLHKNNSIALFTFIAVAMMTLVPLGSNNGMWNAIFGMWLALPLTFVALYNNIFAYWQKLAIAPEQGRILFSGFIVCLIVYSLYSAVISTYHDSKNRLEMTFQVNHPLLKYTFTSKERSIVVQELLDELAKHVSKGDYLLAYNKIPMLHYLTETKPWLNNPWPFLSSREYILQLIKVHENAKRFPVVVRAIGDTSDRNWPRGDKNIADDWHAPLENRELLASILTRNEYRIIWSNDFFEILYPGKI